MWCVISTLGFKTFIEWDFIYSFDTLIYVIVCIVKLFYSVQLMDTKEQLGYQI